MDAKSATTPIVASRKSHTSLSNILLSSKLDSHMILLWLEKNSKALTQSTTALYRGCACADM